MKTFLKKIGVFLSLLLALVVCATPAMAYQIRQSYARISATAGETLTTGQVVCIKDADGLAYKADADDSALRPAVGIVGRGGASGATVEIVVQGVVSGWTTLSEGALGYLSGTAAGVTQVAPAWNQPIGVATNTTTYYVNFMNYVDTSAITALGTLTQAIVNEGSTADDYETTLTFQDPTADNALSAPDDAGMLLTSTLATNGQEVANSIWGVSNGLVLEGATANAYETTLSPQDPTADNAITVPDDAGMLMTSTLASNGQEVANSIWGVSNGLALEGATADAYETTVAPVDPTADRTATIPDASGTVDLVSAATHNYAGGAVAWTLTTAEAQATFISVTNANGAIDAVLPAATAGKQHFIYNNSGQTVTFKVTGQTGGTVATGKYALYVDNGTDVVELYEQP